MAAAGIINDVSLRLKNLLEASVDTVTVEPPKDVSAARDKGLSFWLYQVTGNEFLRNQPRRPAPGASGREADEPLVLDLHFLMTPMYSTQAQALLNLGLAMQALHSQPRVTIPQSNGMVEVSVSLGARSLEELTRIWDSLNEPYRLSVCYDARLVEIDSARTFEAKPIRERAVDEEIVR